METAPPPASLRIVDSRPLPGTLLALVGEGSGAPAAERPHAEKGFAGGGAEEKF